MDDPSITLRPKWDVIPPTGFKHRPIICARTDQNGPFFDNCPPSWMCNSDRTGCWNWYTDNTPNQKDAISSGERRLSIDVSGYCQSTSHCARMTRLDLRVALGTSVVYRGSPAPPMLASAPPPRISTPCHIGLHGWRLRGSGCTPPPPPLGPPSTDRHHVSAVKVRSSYWKIVRSDVTQT